MKGGDPKLLEQVGVKKDKIELIRKVKFRKYMKLVNKILWPKISEFQREKIVHREMIKQYRKLAKKNDKEQSILRIGTQSQNNVLFQLLKLRN